MSDFVHAFLMLLPVLVSAVALFGLASMAVAWLDRDGGEGS